MVIYNVSTYKEWPMWLMPTHLNFAAQALALRCWRCHDPQQELVYRFTSSRSVSAGFLPFFPLFFLRSIQISKYSVSFFLEPGLIDSRKPTRKSCPASSIPVNSRDILELIGLLCNSCMLLISLWRHDSLYSPVNCCQGMCIHRAICSQWSLDFALQV